MDEDGFLDAERAIPLFEITGTVVLHTMTRHQVLRPGRCADRVGLDETQPIESAPQHRGRKEAWGDGEACGATQSSEQKFHRQLDKAWQVALIHCARYAAKISAGDGGNRAAEKLRRVETVDKVGAENQLKPLRQPVALDGRDIHVVDTRQSHTCATAWCPQRGYL